MTSSNGNIFRVTGPLCGEFTGPGEFPTQRPVTRIFDVFLDLCLNKGLSKQPWGWWFENPSWSLWRHVMIIYAYPPYNPASVTKVFICVIKRKGSLLVIEWEFVREIYPEKCFFSIILGWIVDNSCPRKLVPRTSHNHDIFSWVRVDLGTSCLGYELSCVYELRRTPINRIIWFSTKDILTCGTMTSLWVW